MYRSMNTEIKYEIANNTLNIRLIDTRASRVMIAKELHPVLKAAYGFTLAETLTVVGTLRALRVMTIFDEADLEIAEMADMVIANGGAAV